MKKFKLIGLFILMFGISMICVSALASINLGTTKNFAVLASSTITNTGPSTITGNIGLYPGTSFVNPEEITLNGTIHLTDGVASTAKDDLTTVYNQTSGVLPVIRIATELGGQTLTPGIYDSADGTFQITGTLILDGQGDSNAVFVFKAAATLITASASNVSLINSASPCQVFWKVGSSATLGTDSNFVGHIYAQASITATTGAKIEGQLLARTGAVTLDTNTINNPICLVTSTIMGGELPATSTNLYQILFGGILLVVLGIFILSKYYVKAKVNK